MSKPQAIFYREPVNLRLSAEKLADFVRWSGNRLDSGDVFIFFNRKRDHCKIIWHDGEAYCNLDKRLARGTFAPTEEIKISPAAVQKCVYGGLLGQRELLHALMGNVSYLDDARK
jgi:hypothetical protein